MLVKKIAKQHSFKGVEFSVNKKDYAKTEKRNNISINVLGYEDETPYPIYVSKQTFEKHVDLLVLSNSKNSQYVLIKDFNRFMTNKAKRLDKSKFRRYCLQCFSCSEVLKCHVKHCLAINHTKSVSFLEENEYLNFENVKILIKKPFIMYGDFECV